MLKRYWMLIAILNTIFGVNRFGIFFRLNNGRQHVFHFGFMLVVRRVFKLSVYIEPARYTGSKRFSIDFANLI